MTLRIKGGTDKDERKERVASIRGGRLRDFELPDGLPSPMHIHEELQDMTDVLLGRVDPPVNNGAMTLMEVADAYHARASELTMLIQKGEREGTIDKGDPHYKVRTGELRTFLELVKRTSDLGSRRVTAAKMEYEMKEHA